MHLYRWPTHNLTFYQHASLCESEIDTSIIKNPLTAVGVAEDTIDRILQTELATFGGKSINGACCLALYPTGESFRDFRSIEKLIPPPEKVFGSIDLIRGGGGSTKYPQSTH